MWTSHKYSGRDGVNQQLGRGRICDGGNYPQICPHRALATSSVKIKHRFSLQLTFIHPTDPLYVHPLNCCQKINNCPCIQYRKGKHLSAKKLLFHVAMVNISQRPAITLFCFMLCLIYKTEWLVAKIFPEILEHVPAFVRLRLYLRPAWLIVTNQPSKCHIAV